jgi:hypothetical protein
MSRPASGTSPPRRKIAGPQPQPPDAESETPDRFQFVLQVIGSVVAPTTLLTALMFYFGWAHAYWFFRYFGVDISLLGLTTQDFIMRSVDALLVPLSVALIVGLSALWAHSRLTVRLLARPEVHRRLPILANVMAISGFILILVGLLRLLGLTKSFGLFYPLSLAAGTLLLLYASRLHRKLQRGVGAKAKLPSTALLEGTVAFLLVGLSLFWAATNYAATVGETRARQFERELKGYPEAIIYSKGDLHLEAPGVQEIVCEERGGGYPFRYQGLRLMLRSAGHYFLLPETWSASGGVALVVPQGEAVRLQFAVPASGRQSPSTGC